MTTRTTSPANADAPTPRLPRPARRRGRLVRRVAARLHVAPYAALSGALGWHWLMRMWARPLLRGEG